MSVLAWKGQKQEPSYEGRFMSAYLAATWKGMYRLITLRINCFGGSVRVSIKHYAIASLRDLRNVLSPSNKKPISVPIQ